MKFNFPLMLFSFLFLVNGFFIDVGFRMIPIYFFCFPFFLVLLFSQKFRVHRLNIFESALAIFYVFAIATSLYTVSHELSLRFVMGLALVLFCYFTFKATAIYTDSYSNVLSMSLKLFVIFSFFYYVAGLFTIDLTAEHVDFSGVTVEKGIPRMIGLNNDPNLCAAAFLIPLFFFLFDNTRFSRFFFLLSLFCLLATLSRGGILAGFVGFASVFIILGYRAKLYYSTVAIFLGSVCIGLFTIFSDTLGVLLEKRTTGISSGGGRFEVWNNALALFNSNPTFGYGIFTFRHISELEFDISKFAHNTYLEILVETGWIGLLLFLIFCFLLLINSYYIAKYSNSYRYLFPLTTSFLTSMLSLSMYINPIFIFVILLNTIALNDVVRKRNAA